MAALLRAKSKGYCYAFTSALEPLLRNSSARSNFRYHCQMQGLQLPCYPHASLGQAWYSYQLCIAISPADTVAASAVPFSFWCPFQSYFSAVVICTACDTSWLPPSVSFSAERCAVVPFTNVVPLAQHLDIKLFPLPAINPLSSLTGIL